MKNSGLPCFERLSLMGLKRLGIVNPGQIMETAPKAMAGVLGCCG